MKAYKPVVLIVMDGFGVSLEEKGNPVALAKKPTLDLFDANFPMTTLQASGVAVGLPWGEAGNSEVGHLTMGTGRINYHHLPRIIYSIRDGSFFENPAFLHAAEHVKKNNSKLHIIGLVSSGSVHSYIDHLYALLKFVELQGLAQAFLHVITDGKDSPPQEGVKFLAQLEERMIKEFPQTKIASVVGRFFAMDRDEKWDRIEKAYQLWTEAKGSPITNISEYVSSEYQNGRSDEFVEPGYVAPNNAPLATIHDGDAAIIFNFREDSVREISHALIDQVFDRFPRTQVADLFLATMTMYEDSLAAEAAFPPLQVSYPLARVISDAGLRQLHIAETEKYAHVTYFFNGGREKPFPSEERILVSSISTAHFDEVPEMKAADITAKVIAELPRHDFVLVNFANADVVGHSGNQAAAIKAVESVDRCIGEIYEAVAREGGVLVVTGDHGNVEAKRNLLTGERLTEHSLNPVPFYLVGADFRVSVARSRDEVIKQKKETGGILTDVAPTIIELMGLKKPLEMTGSSLLPMLISQHFVHPVS
ncbi:MAG: 2,3-bisphosphoglycerate-independent phosphoglycerate mutase [Candidatus Sungbacteria bacterium]|uniref:2,3-bisphosphoglycerate-independent phosphoglycerate mutase n=1 Tax=Candidatus Sungiibacteriota bacterium TaxID=2750080 RepID=A0A9D6QU40_9BACT|nr:2,3-bisphosphoglycerate-independent phosphoglycerate mutase [Candidatus Sungbacteria bacterium]